MNLHPDQVIFKFGQKRNQVRFVDRLDKTHGRKSCYVREPRHSSPIRNVHQSGFLCAVFFCMFWKSGYGWLSVVTVEVQFPAEKTHQTCESVDSNVHGKNLSSLDRRGMQNPTRKTCILLRVFSWSKCCITRERLRWFAPNINIEECNILHAIA